MPTKPAQHTTDFLPSREEFPEGGNYKRHLEKFTAEEAAHYLKEYMKGASVSIEKTQKL